MSKKRKDPKPIENVVNSVLKNLGMDRSGREQKVFSVWEEVFGPPISVITKPIFINYGTVVVAVRDNAWMQELQFQKSEMKSKLNKTLGKGGIRNIHFKIGSWNIEEPDKVIEEEQKLDRETINQANEAVKNVSDPKLKEQMLRAFLASARRGSDYE
jgi:hypothetical protein